MLLHSEWKCLWLLGLRCVIPRTVKAFCDGSGLLPGENLHLPPFRSALVRLVEKEWLARAMEYASAYPDPIRHRGVFFRNDRLPELKPTLIEQKQSQNFVSQP